MGLLGESVRSHCARFFSPIASEPAAKDERHTLPVRHLMLPIRVASHTGRDAPPAHDVGNLLDGERPQGKVEGCCRVERALMDQLDAPFGQLVEAQAVIEGYGTGGRPSQLADMRQAAKVPTEVARDAPYIGALGDVEVEGPGATLGINADELRTVDGHTPGAELKILPRPSGIIGTSAPNGDGRETRRHLVARSHEARELDFGPPWVEELAGHVSSRRDLALSVVGRRLGAEGEGCPIPLAVEREKPEELRSLPYAHDEHSRGSRVKRTRMPNALLAHGAPHTGDHVVAREANGLVYGYERGERARTTAQRPSSV